MVGDSLSSDDQRTKTKRQKRKRISAWESQRSVYASLRQGKRQRINSTAKQTQRLNPKELSEKIITEALAAMNHKFAVVLLIDIAKDGSSNSAWAKNGQVTNARAKNVRTNGDSDKVDCDENLSSGGTCSRCGTQTFQGACLKIPCASLWPFKCTLCSKAFSKKCHLTAHERIHT